MATSGNFEKKIAGGSTGGYYVGIDWKVNSQSTSNVSSNVTASVYIRSSGNGYNISSSASKNISLTINGTKYTGTNTVGIGTNTKKVLLTKTVDVKHNSDGTKSCAFEASVQIGFSLSGTSLSTVSVSGTGTFDKINVNSAPSMSGSLAVSPSGTIAENTGTINLSWTKATDAQNNANKYVLERFVNGRYEKSYEINNINTVSYTDNISAFGEGTSIYYQIFAYDTFGAMSNGLQSAVITKNRLTGATLASNSSVSSSFSDIALSWSGAKNTNGNTTFKYDITASGLTIYNATNLTSTSATIKIATSSQTGPYILKNDLINAYKNSNFNGTLTFTLKTKNNYGSTKTSTKAISVDMRKAPTAATPVISEDASLSTAFKTVSSTGNKYFIPNGTDKIRITWSGASDVLGQPLKYDVQVQLGNGSFETKVSNTTSTYYDLVLPKQTTSMQIVARVITKTSYNYTSSKDSPAKTLHYYNAPTCDVIKMDRTSSAAKATIKLNANTSIPNINFTTRSYSGASSGTLTNTTAEQTISASGLSDTSTYSWTITFNDDTGFTASNQTKKVDIPTYTPLFSVREKGVGVRTIPNGTYDFEVKGKANINGTLTVNGKPIEMDTSNLVKKTDLTTGNNRVYGKIPQIGTDGVMEVGKFIDFHDGDNGQDYSARITCVGTGLSMNGALATGGNLTVGGTIIPQSYIQLPNNGGSWLNGATNGAIRGSKQSTGSYHPIISQTTSSNHKISMGGIDNRFGFYLYDANRTENGIDRQFEFNLADKTFNTTCESSFPRIHVSNWLYCSGNTGVYWSSYGGGWYMSDSTWVRSYNDKNIYSGGRIKAGTALETRYIDGFDGSNLDINAKGNTLFINANAASGANLNINRQWSGSQGSEISIYNSKGKGWGYIGNSNNSFYRVYGSGGSVSARESKYEISKADTETHYENVKGINIYNYRSISDERDEEGNIVKEHKREDLYLGCMVDELPLETTFYDNEDGNGKAVDMYSYTTMILGALKETIKKVESLEKELEELKNGNTN